MAIVHKSSSSSSSTQVNRDFQNSEFTYKISKSTNWYIIYIKVTLLDQNNDECATAVQAFIKANPNLFPLFPTDNQSLKEQIRTHPFLVENGRALCFSDGEEVEKTEYKDNYFSLGIVVNPTHCPQNHLLEHTFAQQWAKGNNNKCPAGDHDIGLLQIEERLQSQIQDYKTACEKRKNEQDKIVREQLALQTKVMKQQHQIEAIAKYPIKKEYPIMNATKVLVVVGSKVAAEEVAKITTNVVAKNVTKYIPVVSLVIGIISCIMRIVRAVKKDPKDTGEILKAVGKGFLEIGSGALATFVPGWGTAASVAIDLGVGAWDLGEALYHRKIATSLSLKLEDAYKILGLEQSSQPSQEEVNKAYHRQTMLTHPDKNQGVGEFVKENQETLTKALNEAKTIIFKARGWN